MDNKDLYSTVILILVVTFCVPFITFFISLIYDNFHKEKVEYKTEFNILYEYNDTISNPIDTTLFYWPEKFYYGRIY